MVIGITTKLAYLIPSITFSNFGNRCGIINGSNVIPRKAITIDIKIEIFLSLVVISPLESCGKIYL